MFKYLCHLYQIYFLWFYIMLRVTERIVALEMFKSTIICIAWIVVKDSIVKIKQTFRKFVH